MGINYEWVGSIKNNIQMGIACCKDRPAEAPRKSRNVKSMILSEPQSMTLASLQIKNELKRGTLGRSYKVLKKETGEFLAMKVINKQTIENTGLTINEKFKMTLTSPFVVHLQSAFSEGDYFYTVTEFVEGSEIFEELKKHSKFEEDAVRFYLGEVILALEQFHSQNIVYRNLNPERILVDRDGHLKLADFGIYCVFEWAEDKKMATMSEAVDYKSPEQVQNDEFDFRSDFWQLGILAYEMLRGRSPFINNNRELMEQAIQAADPEFEDSFSPQARDFISKLLRKNPEERLGAGSHGFHDIKTHPFFSDHKWNWSDAERKILTPPLIPEVSHNEA